MVSGAERLEGKTGCLHPFAHALMAEEGHLHAAIFQRAGDRQLRGNVSATVHRDEQDSHGALPSVAHCGTPVAAARIDSVKSSIRSCTSPADKPRSRRSSFHA